MDIGSLITSAIAKLTGQSGSSSKQAVVDKARAATPTPSPTPTPKPMPTPPSVTTPFDELIKSKWSDVPIGDVQKVIGGESSFRPRIVHVNSSSGKGKVISIPEGYTREQWLSLRRKYPNIDVGLMQINTNSAMSSYLKSKGLTYYDLLDPEANLEVAHDLYAGKIPNTHGGWSNWVATKKIADLTSR